MLLKGVFAKNERGYRLDERGYRLMKYQLFTNASKNNWRLLFVISEWFVYDTSWMLHLFEFVWALRSSVLVVFNNFLLIDATDRSKISNQKRFFIALDATDRSKISDQKRFFFTELSLYPLSFFANSPFKTEKPSDSN